MWKSRAQQRFEAEREVRAEKWDARAKQSKAEARKSEAMVRERQQERERGRSKPNADRRFCERGAAADARVENANAKQFAQIAADVRRTRRGLWR